MRTTGLVISITASVWLLVSCGQGSEPSLQSNQTPAIAPAIPTVSLANISGDTTEPTTEHDAFRLLEQATFGPRLADITDVSNSGTQSWIRSQMQKPATFMSDGLTLGNSSDWNEYVNVWWRMAITADDQLRQRVAFALSQILVVSADEALGNEQEGLANYYDILLRHAFGNYRDLLEEVTLNPVMGEYLSMKGNRRPDEADNVQPDENYARELLQLFSIGQVLLNPDGSPMVDQDGVPLPAYDQTTVENFARVFTGWHFANAENFRWAQNKDYLSPMRPWEQYHDTNEKTLLNDLTLPAGQSAREDLNAALNNIFNHPNVGPFISKQLIQRLVTSNPSPQYVQDVAAVFNSNHAGERGSLASTVQAILLHNEARYGHERNPNTFGKLKEPLIRVTQLWRAFEVNTIQPQFNYRWVEDELGQAPLNSPSVFNFFRPDYSLPGELRDNALLSPEFQILNENSIIQLTNRLLGNALWSHNFKNDISAQRIVINIDREMAIEPDREALLNHLDLLLLGGNMSEELRDAANELLDSRSHGNAASQRVGEAIFLIITSPEAAVQI